MQKWFRPTHLNRLCTQSRHRLPSCVTPGQRAYINPRAVHESTTADQELEAEEDRLRLKQLTSNARTLLRARRHSDAESVIDEGLDMFPWNSALWFWKIASKTRDSRGALQVWDTMKRLGLKRYPEHYDIMASAIAYGDARHFLFDLYDELNNNGEIANPKFYVFLFNVCRDSLGTPGVADRLQDIWQEISMDAEKRHLTEHPDVLSSYRSAVAGLPDRHSKQSFGENQKSSINRDPVEMENSDGISRGQVDVLKTESHRQFPDDTPHSEVSTDDNRPQTRSTSTVSLPEEANFTRSSGSRTASVGHSRSQADTMERIRGTLEPFFQRNANITAHRASLTSAKEILNIEGNASIVEYNYVIKSASRVQKPEALLGLLDDCLEKGLKPDCRTYVCLHLPSRVLTDLYRIRLFAACSRQKGLTMRST